MASRIRTKLVRIFSLALIPIMMLAAISLYNQSTIHKAAETVNSVSAEFRLLNEMQLALERALMPSNDYIITGNGAYKKEFEAGAEEMERLIREAWVTLDKLERELDPERVAEEKRILSGVIESWSHIKDISTRIFSIKSPVGSAEAARLMEEMDYKWGFPAIEALGRWHKIDQSEYGDAVKSADGAWFRAWLIMAGGLVLTAAFAVGIGYYYSGVFVWPIERLREHSLKIASGDFSSKAGIRTDDEIEELSEAMDRMSAELLALYGDLERKVEARTAELKEKEELYRSLFNGTNDAIFLHPVPGGSEPLRFTDANDTACSRLGYTREEFLALSPEQIDAPGHEAERKSAEREIAQNGHAIFEMVHVAKDGRLIPVEISSKVFELNGRPMGLSIARDVTERKRAEEKASREMRLNESIVSNMPAGVAFLDNDFVLRKFNPSYGEMIRKYSRCAPEEALGVSYFDYVPGSREQVEGWFKRVRDTGESSSVQGFELKLTEDRSTYWDTSITPVFDEGGKVEGILILTQDITERKTGENALRERVEELEMFRKLTLKRELRLRELKDRIEALEKEIKGKGLNGHA